MNPTPFVGEAPFRPPTFNPVNGSMVGVAKPIYITFNLPEKDLDLVRTAQRGGTPDVVALDRTDAHPVASDGKLDVIDNKISADSGTFKLRAVFPNADIALFRLEQGSFSFDDVFSHTRTGAQRLVCQATYLGGRLMARMAEPPPAPWIA